METLLRDLAHAARTLMRSPGFAMVSVATLGLGIGATTAVFSVVNGLLLRPPTHVAEPERLVSIWTSDFSGPPYGASSYPDYELFREQTDAMAGVAAFGLEPVNLIEADETVRLAAERVSGNYFEVLGIAAAQGRVLRSKTASTGRPSSSSVTRSGRAASARTLA